MTKLRDALVLIAVAAAFAVSLAMFRQAVGVASPWFGLMLMLIFTGLSAFARPLFLLRMPAFLRKPRAFETKGVYRALRVPEFGALLRGTPLRSLNSDVYLRQGSDDLSDVIAQLESAEAAHVYAAILLLPYIVYAVVEGWFGAAAVLIIVEIGFNLYPVMHLRWARFRLGRVQERMHSRASTHGRADPA
jgi:Glycosyl-4,4'-diaponeurosporenoate acyltransferase